jgi:hypothetical protein
MGDTGTLDPGLHKPGVELSLKLTGQMDEQLADMHTFGGAGVGLTR